MAVSKSPITEKLVKERIKKILTVYAKHNDLYTFCPMMVGFGDNGHPDRIVVINGVFIGIESKRDRNNHHTRPELKPKPNEAAQKIQAERIIAAGGLWVCIHSENLNELLDLLDLHAAVARAEFPTDDQKRIAALTQWRA